MATIFIDAGGEVGVWASSTAALGGTLAAAVNKVEHEEQVGMVFELIRNCARLCRRRSKHAWVSSKLSAGRTTRCSRPRRSSVRRSSGGQSMPR
jgi:hypothetical protein